MESLFSISGTAQVLGWIGIPILAGAVLLTALVLSGGAERLIDVAEDVQARRSVSRATAIEHQEAGGC